MINFEVIGGVSFSKGCYPGQEVCRSQYRGKLRRRMQLAHCAAAARPVPTCSPGAMPRRRARW